MSGILRCPTGIRTFGAYPDPNNNIIDPSFYYDCSKTKFATLKRCKNGEFYDIVTSSCIHIKKKSKPKNVQLFRKIDDDEQPKADRTLGKKDDKTEVKPKPKKKFVPYISDKEMKDFLKTRGSAAKMKQPTLGRAIKLGAMYYAQDDRIAYDENLWKDSTLAAQKTIQNSSSSSFKIQRSQDILDRLNLFNMDMSLSLTLMSGALTMKGSAGYLSEQKKTEKDVSIAFFYESIRQTEFINQNLRMNPDFPQICKDTKDENGPTHVVTSVTKGITAVMDFTKRVGADAAVTRIKASLEIALQLTAFNIEAKAAVNLTENQTDSLTGIRVSFAGDTILDTNPTNLEQANKALSDLSTKAKTAETIVYYDLSPISMYCNDRTALINELNEEKVKRVQRIMQELEKIPMKVNDLLERNCSKSFSQSIGKHLKIFLQEFNSFKTVWMQNLAMILPKIRTSVKAEAKLISLINEYLDSPFYLTRASFFLDNRRREMDTIDMITATPQEGIVVEKSANGDGNRCIFRHKYTIQYTLYILPTNDIVERYMNTSLQNKYSEANRWFSRETVISRAGAVYQDFLRFYEKNKDAKDNCYLIRLKPSNEAADNKQVTVEVLDQGISVSKDFYPAKDLKITKFVTTSYEEIIFPLDINKNNISKVEDIRITVDYTYEELIKKEEEEKEEKQNVTSSIEFKVADNGSTEITLQRLLPNTTYMIKAFVNYRFGDETNYIKFNATTSSTSEPRNLKAPTQNLSTTSIFLSWNPPSYISGDQKDLRYKLIFARKNSDKEDVENRETPKIVIVNGLSTNLHGLKPYTPYLITIEVIYSSFNANLTNTTSIQSDSNSQPIVVHRRSMLVVYTKPEPPSEFNVTLLSIPKKEEISNVTEKPAMQISNIGNELNKILSWNHSANVSWSSLIDKEHFSNNIYTLKWEVRNKSCHNETDKTNRIVEHCEYVPVDNSLLHSTDQSHYLITDLLPGKYYGYQVMVKTLHGSSEYSAPIILFSGNEYDKSNQSSSNDSSHENNDTTTEGYDLYNVEYDSAKGFDDYYFN